MKDIGTADKTKNLWSGQRLCNRKFLSITNILFISFLGFKLLSISWLYKPIFKLRTPKMILTIIEPEFELISVMGQDKLFKLVSDPCLEELTESLEFGTNLGISAPVFSRILIFILLNIVEEW